MDWMAHYRRHFREQLAVRGVRSWGDDAPGETAPEPIPPVPPAAQPLSNAPPREAPATRLDFGQDGFAALAQNIGRRLSGQLPPQIVRQMVTVIPDLTPKVLRDVVAEKLAEQAAPKPAAQDQPAAESAAPAKDGVAEPKVRAESPPPPTLKKYTRTAPLTKIEAFIQANTDIRATELAPEIRLHLATEITVIWEATEAALDEKGLPPPFWAFAWPGGQGLARYIIDTPELVRGRRVLDFAAGCGIAAIAAIQAGASHTLASEIDDVAVTAIALNASLNDADVEPLLGDLIGREADDWDIVLVGDVCYEEPLASRLTAWLRGFAGAGVPVLLADPGRNHLPKEGLERVFGYTVPTTRELENRVMQETVIYRLTP